MQTGASSPAPGTVESTMPVAAGAEQQRLGKYARGIHLVPDEVWIRLHDEGLSTGEAAERLPKIDKTLGRRRIDPIIVWRNWKRLDLSLRDRGGPKNDRTPQQKSAEWLELEKKVEALAVDHTRGEMAEILHSSVNTVRRICRENDIRPVKSRRVYETRIPYSEFRSVYEQGGSDAEIGKKLGVSMYTVRKYRQAHELKPAPIIPLRIQKLPREDLMSYIESGLNVTQIADGKHMAKKTVKLRVAEEGLTLPGYRKPSDEELTDLRQRHVSTTTASEESSIPKSTLQTGWLRLGFRTRLREEDRVTEQK